MYISQAYYWGCSPVLIMTWFPGNVLVRVRAVPDKGWRSYCISVLTGGMPLGLGDLPRYFPSQRRRLNLCVGPLVTTTFVECGGAECNRLITWDNIQTRELQYMQGTFYTSGIGNVSGMDCVHVPLWITYVGDRCRQLLWGVMTGFRNPGSCW